MGNRAGFSLRPLSSEFCLCCLLNSGPFLGKKPACGRQRRWYQRAEGRGPTGCHPSTALPQLLPEPGLCIITNIFLLPLGLISQMCPLTGCPRKAGILQGEFFCTEY